MTLKILHTSDWHIGKQLMKIDFNEDMELFFSWLIELIESEKIDVVLMCLALEFKNKEYELVKFKLN